MLTFIWKIYARLRKYNCCASL